MRNSWFGKDMIWAMNVGSSGQPSSSSNVPKASTGYVQQPLVQQPLIQQPTQQAITSTAGMSSEEEYFKKRPGVVDPRFRRPTEHMKQTYLAKR